jgi:serine/threonine-protein kinase
MLGSSSVAAPSRQTIGRYELLFELGRGGMAVLHLARNEGVAGFSKLFAIKQILPHLACDPPFVEMFLNESRIAARLSHPNLCTVFELGQDDGELFLVMEYLDGVPWEVVAAALPRDARGLQLTAGVLAQACEGLHYAHTFRDVDGTAMPVVHRDVSPQNVFVSADGVCRVLDFGVSKIATDHRRTRTGLLKGKLPYMAPEQLRGEAVDGRADVWAVGVMLWEALTGDRLFARDTDFLIYEAITGGAIPSVNAPTDATRISAASTSAAATDAAATDAAPTSAGAPRYPEAIDGVIARALGRERETRYATARDLARDLTRIASEVGGAASREQIADAVAGLCGDQLAARKQAISIAMTGRALRGPGDPGTVGTAGPDRPGAQHRSTEPAHATPGTGADAAATLSMAMRKDSIVVERQRRRRWPAGLAVAAVVAGGLAVVSALHGGSAPLPARPAPASGGATVSAPSGSTAPARASAAASAPSGSTAPAGGSATVSARSDSSAPAGRSAAVSAPSGSTDPAGKSAAASAPSGSTAPAGKSAAASAPSGSTAPAGKSAAASAPSGTTATAGGYAAIAPRAGASASRPSRDRSAPDAAAGAHHAPAAAPADPGWYAIDSAPYATVFIDERKIGDTPLDRISLAAGTHRVRAVLADGRQRTFSIDIAPDRKTSSGTLTW